MFSLKCAACKAKIEIITKIDDEDSKVYELIINGINTAKMALHQHILPKTLTHEEIRNYYEKIIEDNIYYNKLYNDWWKYMRIKFNIDDSYLYMRVNTNDNEIFHCLDEENNEIIEG
jgi:hypothetical protein